VTGAASSEPYTIRYEDEHLLVVEKAAGVVVHPAAGNREGTLSQLLAEYTVADEPGEEERAGIVHRLDKGTSGLMVVARSAATRKRLQEQIAAREVTREYLALVEGRPPARSGTIEAPIGRDPRVRTRMAVGGSGARPAVTHFQFERMLPTTTLLRARLETGRTHQIRVHLRAIDHPVVADPDYGHAGMLGLERQFLHATLLRFEHPLEPGREIEVVAELPDDLAAALERAERISSTQ
jgi:23S rRNA pseudouridine1911/1915/1917 synthase